MFRVLSTCRFVLQAPLTADVTMTQLVNLKTMTATHREDVRVFLSAETNYIFNFVKILSIIYATLGLMQTYHLITDDSSYLNDKSDVTDSDMN